SRATLLKSSTAVFGHSIHGSSMFCQVGTPRSTIYALESPAKSITIAVSKIQTPIWPFEIGKDEPESAESSPPRPPGGSGGCGGRVPVRRSSVKTGISSQFPSKPQEHRDSLSVLCCDRCRHSLRYKVFFFTRYAVIE